MAARVAAYRDMLPSEFMVDYADAPVEAAELAAQILKARTRTSAPILEWLHTNFAQDDMVQRYADIILNARKQSPLVYRPTLFSDATQFVLAPWCYVAENGMVYHDFRGQWLSTSRNLALLMRTPVTMQDGTPGQVEALYRAGYLVPLMD